eukprot:Em0006g474a
MATAPTTMPMDMNMHMSMGTTMATMMGNDTMTMQVGVTYLLMLAVMSYNGAIFITVCIGAGFGYLSFGWVSLYIGEKSKREQAGYCH